MKKMRCDRCIHFRYNYIMSRYEEYDMCGLHGGVRVVPGEPQRNLDTRGGCGYYPNAVEVQLTLDFGE